MQSIAEENLINLERSAENLDLLLEFTEEKL